MIYSIDKNGKAAYMQLYEQVKKDIVNGVYPCGTKLPSKRIMAEETGVSVITVQHTYEILCDEGYVESRQRSGYFVVYRESDFISSAVHTESSVRKPEGLKIKTEFPFSVLSKTMRKVLSEYGEDILMKSPNQGCMELRRAISAYLTRSTGINVQPRQIVIGAGAEYLYSLTVQLLGNDRKFALEDPCYEKIRQVYSANGVKYDMLKMAADGIQTSELERTDATVLHITPFNSYPSGVTATASKRYEYIRWAEKHKGVLIEDNYASELTVSMKNDDTVFSLSNTCYVVYINTFSETVAPSMRVGYMVLPSPMVPEFEEKLGFYSCTVPVFEQYVLAELINNGDFERHINRVRRQRRKERQGR